MVCMLLYGCSIPKDVEATKNISDDISVYEDEINGVTCYILTSEMINGYDRSLSCVPNKLLRTYYEIK